eukprot:gene20799-22839_t
MDKPVLMSVVQSLLDNQAKNFKTTIELMTGDLRNEIKELRKEVSDLKISLQFSQAKQEEMVRKVELLEKRTDANEQSVNQSFDYIEAMEDNVEYMENQNRRNNVKILGMKEDPDNEKSWDGTEELVKNLIKDKLGSSKSFEIERCHRVGYQKKQSSHNRYQANQSGRSDEPRPIVAKFLRWKDKEEILKLARQAKPVGVRFVQDLSRRTLLRRKERIPELIEARKRGKIAYFVMDKLVIKSGNPNSRITKPPDNESVSEGVNEPINSDNEITFS